MAPSKFSQLCVNMDAKGLDRPAIKDPPGFDERVVREGLASTSAPAKDKAAQDKTAENARRRTALQQRVWNEAWGDLKSIFGVVIQMYFVGNALSIFTLMAVYYNLQAPLLGLWTIKKRFYDVYSLEGVDWAQPMAVFAAVQLAKLAVVTWKLDQIGLVPKQLADFFSYTPVPAPAELVG